MGLDFRRNLRKAWRAVTPDDLAHGLPAYPNYNATISGLADLYGVPLERASLAFVIMSPRNDLLGNIRSLATCLEARKRGIGPDGFSVTGFAKWKARAMLALDGKVTLRHVKGPKVVAFHDNILHHDESQRVCVDGHMICIASGRDMTMFDALMWARSLGYAAIMRMIEREIATLARELRLPRSAVQATLWTSRKRLKKIRANDWPENRPLAPDQIKIFPMEGKA